MDKSILDVVLEGEFVAEKFLGNNAILERIYRTLSFCVSDINSKIYIGDSEQKLRLVNQAISQLNLVLSSDICLS